MNAQILQRCSIDTAAINPERRARYWEDQCRDALFSFRCSPHADEGLRAHQTCLDIGPLRIALTCANEHVIERTPDMVRAFPRESMFVNLILTGEAFIYQRGHCAKMHAGEMLVYDARHPYLFGGARDFTLLHIDIPAPLFQTQLARIDMARPIQIAATRSTHQLYQRTLSRLLLNLLEGPERAEWPTAVLTHQVCDLLGAMLGQAEGRGAMSALSAGHLLAAKQFIEEHYTDEGLAAEQIAVAVGVSARHLRRLFAAQELSVGDFVLACRLDHAHHLLTDPRERPGTVAETAYRCGFASHPHFSRAFKQHFGVTPTEAMHATRH
ncbi:MAG: hypothetical protein RLZZ373_2120 [Pseudomonadota bacterium]|jgi:AraC-like DNA-binding protein